MGAVFQRDRVVRVADVFLADARKALAGGWVLSLLSALNPLQENAAFNPSTKSVFSQEKPPSASGSLPKWP